MPGTHQVPAGVRHLAVSVGASQFARHLPFDGSSDPSLPTGIWQADVEVTGDASGGTISADVLLQGSGEPEDTFYSLEQWLDQHDTAGGTTRVLRFLNQHNYRDPATPISSSHQGAGAGGSGTATGWQGRDIYPQRYFVGRAAPPSVAVQLFIRFETTNTLNIAYRIHAWGYKWSGRAIATPMGPRRPPFGVFGD